MQKRKIIVLLILFISLTLFIYADAYDFQFTKKIEWKEKILFIDITREIDLLREHTPDLRYTVEKEIDKQLYTFIFNTLLDIKVDSQYTLYDYLQKDHDIYEKIDTRIGLCKKEYARFLNSMKKVNVRYSWPLYGENGLISCFVNHTTANPIPVKLGFVAAKKYTGILIYASGEYNLYGKKTKGALVPVFFPDFYGEDMNRFFDKSKCDPGFLKKWGMVEYTDSLDEARYTERIGNNPLRTSPLKLFGKVSSDLILPEEAVNQILSLAENRQILQEGRILIVCNAL